MRRSIALAVLLAQTASAGAADLTLFVEGLRNRAGSLSVCLFEEQKAFPDCAATPSARRKTVPASSADKPIVFRDLPSGTYAVTVLHDENADGQLDAGLLGIPKEGVGITNNRMPKFSAPRFSDARFTMPNGRRQTVRIVYW